jgi:hypothetical protein
MTQALAAAVASASRLPDEEQDVLASLLMAEMDSEGPSQQTSVANLR